MLYRTFFIFILIIFSTSFIFAHCGLCEVEVQPEEPKRSNAFITTTPSDGHIEGFILASCGMCQFDDKQRRGCSLAVKIGDNVYSLVGHKITDYGDMHDANGFCNIVRVAYTSGVVKDNMFYPDSFTLVDSNTIK